MGQDLIVSNCKPATHNKNEQHCNLQVILIA